MVLKNKKINFIGDSITEGCGTSGPDKNFCSIIEREYGAVCRNYGISGTRISKQSPPYEEENERDFCSRVNDMDPDADIVVVFGGTNDFGHGSALIGNMSDRTPYTFYGALHTLYRSLIERYSEADIVILTPLHRGDCEDCRRGQGINKITDTGTLKEYVEAIRQTAEYYSLPVFDLYAAGGLQPNVPIIRERYMPDSVHPNDAGHALLAKKIATYLENTL